MGNKTGLEYDIRHVETNVHIGYQDAWCCATERIGKLCADMNDGGWTLSTMSWPSLSHAVLVFTRPERAD